MRNFRGRKVKTFSGGGGLTIIFAGVGTWLRNFRWGGVDIFSGGVDIFPGRGELISGFREGLRIFFGGVKKFSGGGGIEIFSGRVEIFWEDGIEKF